ncbi:recombinase family protein [Sphingomonas flavescens]|uniref:recombinase family protein n=1 Tax=Sphingomonas flavescens TaxID=3132797 RepID=UPI00280402B3|nr:recombinase family protein [Sphingomonas limnosediminicola]
MSRVRCAIYTRKSSDEGLDQEFNSLDAQYEACKAYIASQRQEGWRMARERYDDGGISGGTLERPAIKALLADVAAGKIDVIVIYKIDRLTRSLTDFARIVEQLEQANASFVSVTQSFNTKTSMGRLMLHVLLSFAQFEREVGAERVRDKIAASKAKGMWMGGTVPLGYDVVDKKLVINQAEADTVRAIFAQFVVLKSVQATLRWAQREGLQTKQRQRVGKVTGGRHFEYGSLRCLLSNRLYVGEITHRGQIHQGQHEPVLDRLVFEDAQSVLASLNNSAVRGPKLVSASLLQGLIVDRHGRTMGPVHTVRSGQRFRYYVTHLKTIREGSAGPYRIAARSVESIIVELLGAQLRSRVTSVDSQVEVERTIATLSSEDQVARRELVIEQIRKVIIGDAVITVELNNGATLERSIERVRQGNDAKLIVGKVTVIDKPIPDPQLIILLLDGRRARILTESKPNLELDRVAKLFGRSTERFKRLLRLSYLSPTIVDAIIGGNQPARLTNRFLQNLDGLPLSWPEQEALLLR